MQSNMTSRTLHTGSEHVVDRVIYFAVFFAPLSNIPQLLKVWGEGTAEGVSALSWFCFAGISALWLAYGLVHRDRPIIYMNVALICVQTAVAVGAVVH